MNKLTKIISAGLAVAVFVVTPLIVGVRSASANTGYALSVPISTIKRGAVGSVHVLASENIEQKYQGMECSVNAVAKNQGSVHPGNNLTVASGGSSVVLENVERQGGISTEASGELTLGPKVTVSLTMGRDKVFSGGMNVNITCVEKEIEVCRGGQVITIKEGEREDSDTSAPCPAPEVTANITCEVVDGEAIFTLNTKKTSGDVDVVFTPKDGTVMPNGDAVEVTAAYNDGTGEKTVKITAASVADCTPEKEIEVCRDGKIISILESEKKDSDTTVCPAEVKAVVTELPNTGVGSVVGLLGATFLGGTGISQLRMRRNARKNS